MLLFEKKIRLMFNMSDVGNHAGIAQLEGATDAVRLESRKDMRRKPFLDNNVGHDGQNSSDSHSCQDLLDGMDAQIDAGAAHREEAGGQCQADAAPDCP